MSAPDQERGPLLRKWHTTLAATRDKALAGADRVVLTWMLDYAGPPAFEAYPSLSTISRVTQLNRSTVVRSLNRLVSTGYLVVARPGSRSTSTRYGMTFKGESEAMTRKEEARRSRDPAGGADAPRCSQAPSPKVGAATHTSRCADAPSLGAPRPPYTNQHTAPQARGVVGGISVLPPAPPSAAPDAAGAAGAPKGARPSARRPGELFHGWFWDRYPKKVKAMDADLMLDDLLAQGVSQEVIEAGASHYAEHIKRSHWPDKYISAPLQWLKDKRWVDRHAAPARQPDAERQAPAGTKQAAKVSKQAQGARSGTGNGVGATKPAAASKARLAETDEERAARLSAAREKRAAEQEARARVAADALKANIEKAVAGRRQFLAAMDEAGIPRELVSGWVTSTLELLGKIKEAARQPVKARIQRAIDHDIDRADNPSQSDFVEFFAGGLPSLAPRIVKRFKEREARLAAEEAARRG